MEDDQSTMNHNSNEILRMTSHSRRLQVRRGILRQTTTLRSSPYNSTLSNIRRRQTSLIASQTITNLLTNIGHENQIETEDLETDMIPSDDENDNFEVFVDFSNVNNHSTDEQNPSYHSLSTIDFDPNDDDDEGRYYYTSNEQPLIIPDHPIDLTHEEYSSSSSSLNPNSNDDEDLSIEIILETSQNNSHSSTPRRRHSIISSNLRNNRGLHLSDILNIPQKLYHSLKEQIQITTQCYICLEDFQSIDFIKILPCQHIFHVGCINQWLRGHSTCPYCRTTVLIDLEHNGRRQRIHHTRRNLTRSSTNNSLQTISLESPTIETRPQP